MNFEDVARIPYPGASAPIAPSFNPSGEILSYLHAEQGQLGRQLWGLKVDTLEKTQLFTSPNDGDTEENLSHEEKLRRERQRLMAVGVTSYSWAPHASHPRLLVPLQGNIYIQDQGQGNPRVVYKKEMLGGGAIDAQISPDGQWIAFVVDRELYVISAEGEDEAAPLQLTEGCSENLCLSHGLADFLAQEEMDRYHGFWWSPDSRSIAFTEVDESAIFNYRIMHQGKDDVNVSTQEDHRYPFAGGPNPSVKLAVLSLPENASKKGGKAEYNPVWMDLWNEAEDGEFYIGRVHWFPDGSLGVQVENREQTYLKLLRCCPMTGASTTLLEERTECWVNLHHLLRCLPRPVSTDLSDENQMAVEGSFSFLWGSERSGYMHLYLYTYAPGQSKASLIQQVTSGDWIVEAIVGVDQVKNMVYFLGTFDSPLEKHLYATPLLDNQSTDAQQPCRLTPEGGFWHAVMDQSATRFVCVGSKPDTPAKMILYEVHKGSSPGHATAITEIHAGEGDPRVAALRPCLSPPEIITVRARDDQALLYTALYAPDPAKHGPPPYPTIVAVYGGPHVQRVNRSWSCTVDMRAQYLRDIGFLVVKCDNRGSSRRGVLFEGAIKHNMGSLEIQDQEDAVAAAVNLGLADPGRVGIYGWSYGGYMSAMALCKAPHVFKVAVSGAPVTSWDGYDTHYTERYMGTPESNPSGYAESSVLMHTHKMEGKLMLVHGLIDENVHFRHTARLINALIAARKHYDFLLFPDERHSPRKLQDRIYMEQRISDYFVQHLMKDSFKSASNL